MAIPESALRPQTGPGRPAAPPRPDPARPEAQPLPDPAPAALLLPAPPRLLSAVARGLFALATALVLLIVLLVVAQIAARNLWHIGLPRAEELSRLAGILAVYMTAPLLALNGQHVAVEAFTGLMPRAPRRLCALLAELSTLGFALLTLWGGWLYLERAWKFRTPALGLQNLWYFGPVMGCFALVAVIGLWRIIAVLRSGRAAP